MSLDPTQPPARNVALTLAQAALQRQTQLLEALGGQNTGAGPATPSSPVLLSAQARAHLSLATEAELFPTPQAPLDKTAAPAAPLPWPVATLDKPTQALLDTLLHAAPASGAPGAKLLGAQPWPQTLVQHIVNAAAEHSANTPHADEWQVWQIPASVVQTAAGRQTLQATLFLPSAGTAAQPSAETENPPAMAPPATPRLLLLPEQTKPLASAWFALLLETDSGAPRNALLALEFGAPQAATLYGRDLFAPRSDPWQQQAVLLASGWAQRVAARQGQDAGPTCQTPGCPYQGRAACPQPFCPDALRILPLR
ncbi:MAG TPA: hypothetical protein VFY31_05660 [Macromonas sp.]|nr:hypothetical protein [Macromonas sp.]